MQAPDNRSAFPCVTLGKPRRTMRTIPTLLLCLSLPLLCHGQTTWNVEVGGSTLVPPGPYYAPQHITIDVGDIVVWNNVSGTHNVNGTTILFPGNPEGFTSGSPQGGNWTFSHPFTIPGVYNYHCTQGNHSATQFGSITVLSGTGVSEMGGGEVGIQLYPNPTDDLLVVEAPGLDIRVAEVFSVDGRRVLEQAMNAADRMELNVAALPAGAWFLRLLDGEGRTYSRPFRRR